jgi:hypothetical protein
VENLINKIYDLGIIRKAQDRVKKIGSVDYFSVFHRGGRRDEMKIKVRFQFSGPFAQALIINHLPRSHVSSHSDSVHAKLIGDI